MSNSDLFFSFTFKTASLITQFAAKTDLPVMLDVALYRAGLMDQYMLDTKEPIRPIASCLVVLCSWKTP